MTTQNYVSIMKRRDQENNILRKETMSFAPKMIGGRIGTILDL